MKWEFQGDLSRDLKEKFQVEKGAFQAGTAMWTQWRWPASLHTGDSLPWRGCLQVRTRVDIRDIGGSEPQIKALEPQEMELLRKVERDLSGYICKIL